MTQRDIDLDIEVTPAVEDAFFCLRQMQADLPEPSDDDDETLEEYEKKLDSIMKPALNAGGRLLDKYDDEERWKAIGTAFRMLDNIEKYGVPCLAWS